MKVIKVTAIFIFLFSVSVFAQESNSVFVAKGDSAFKVLNNDKALECYLKACELNPNDYEAAWKISRAYVDIGEKLEGDERANHFKKGEEFAKKAVELKPEGSYGHLYLSIAIGKVALDAGKKEQVRLSKEVKKELDIAIKYDPENDIAYHVLGRWNRKMANLGWIQRKFADLFLGGIPKDASNENAIASFKKSVELKPAHINHHLELGITYEMNDKEDLAIKEFETCLSLPISDANDDKYKKIAQEHLDDLK